MVLAKNGEVDCALATLVAFDALLRVSEVTAIRICDVSAPEDIRRGSSFTSSSLSSSSSRVCIRLATTKTGRNQWVELYNSDLASLLLRHVDRRLLNSSAEDPLFAFPSVRPVEYFRRCFIVTCSALGLDDCHFRPHSLRHGGATHAHMHLDQSIEEVMHRGRWQSNSTCRTYIQSGNAALLTQSLPSDVVSHIRHVMHDWVSLFYSYSFPDPQMVS